MKKTAPQAPNHPTPDESVINQMALVIVLCSKAENLEVYVVMQLSRLSFKILSGCERKRNRKKEREGRREREREREGEDFNK